MFGSNSNLNNPRQPTALERGLASACGVAAAYVGTPLAFTYSKGWVSTYTTDHYTPDLSDVATWLWFCVLAVTLFYATRLGVFDLLRKGRGWFHN